MEMGLHSSPRNSWPAWCMGGASRCGHNALGAFDFFRGDAGREWV